MMGETVTLLLPTVGEADPFGNASATWAAVEVGGCLVRPLDGEALGESTRPDGVKVVCNVSLPKGSTDGYSAEAFRGARVALTDRGMPAEPTSALRVSGSPFRIRPCPTKWDVTLECGRVDG